MTPPTGILFHMSCRSEPSLRGQSVCVCQDLSFFQIPYSIWPIDIGNLHGLSFYVWWYLFSSMNLSSHLNHLPSWVLILCCSRLLVSVNFLLHWWHWNRKPSFAVSYCFQDCCLFWWIPYCVSHINIANFHWQFLKIVGFFCFIIHCCFCIKYVSARWIKHRQISEFTLESIKTNIWSFI